MTTYYILRHAEKERGDFYNPHLRHQDEPLTHKGRQEAQKLYSYFFDKHIMAIYVSGYQRTWQTAGYLAGQLGLAPAVDERLNEIDNGCLENMPDAEIQRKYPEVWSAYTQRSADFRFPEGETGEEAQRRIVDFLEEMKRLHQEENLLLVSHEGLIRALLCYIVKTPVFNRWNFQIDFCGLMEIHYQPDFQAWKLIRFNQNLNLPIS